MQANTVLARGGTGGSPTLASRDCALPSSSPKKKIEEGDRGGEAGNVDVDVDDEELISIPNRPCEASSSAAADAAVVAESSLPSSPSEPSPPSSAREKKGEEEPGDPRGPDEGLLFAGGA